jgi:hypothetical protein
VREAPSTAPVTPQHVAPMGAKAKKLGSGRKVATKKTFAAGARHGFTRTASAKPRLDPCLPAEMQVDPAIGDAVLGSMCTADNVRLSGSIHARRSAAQPFESKAVSRRKQAVPALAAVR